MHTTMFIVSVLLVVFFLTVGVAGVTTGWTLPWNRGRVLRPRLAGWGALLLGSGFGAWMFLGPLHRPAPEPTWVTGIAWAGWVAFMAGLVTQWLATRPGRSGPTPTTPASS